MATMNTKADYLAKIPLFKEIPKDKLSEIAKGAGFQIVSPHTVIYREGDAGDNFYMINSGKVRISKSGRGGDDIFVAELGPGDFFGHLSIFTGELRGANVEALEETKLTILSKDQFDKILKEYSNVSFAFAKQMSQYLAMKITVIKKKSEPRFRVIKTSWLDYVFILALSLLFGVIFNYSNPNGIELIPRILSDEGISRVAPSLELVKRAKSDVFIVDARPSALYEHMHIKGAVNIPLALFDIMYMMELSELDKEKNIIVYGRTISSHYDEKMAGKLILRGHKNVAILEGGLSAWKEKGYPIVL